MESRHKFGIDLDLYTRTQGLFDAKRDKLRPDAIERLARDVVERLASSRDHGASLPEAVAPATVRADMVEVFCDVLLTPDGPAALRFLEDELASIVTNRADLYGYIAAASRRLGERWDADEITLLEVTVSVGKLYALVRSVGSHHDRAPISSDPQKVALFASVPGEKHTLGVTIGAEVFRDAGWDVDLLIGRSHDELLQHAQAARPSVIGLSLSTAAGLDALARMVVALRLVLPTALVAVADGPDTDEATLRNLVDIDLVITDAQSAERELSRLLRLRATG